MTIQACFGEETISLVRPEGLRGCQVAYDQALFTLTPALSLKGEGEGMVSFKGEGVMKSSPSEGRG